MPNPIVESKVAESANAAAVAHEASLLASRVLMSKAMADELAKYFGPDNRFLDMTRINRICDDVREIKELLNNGFVRKESFDPVRLAVYGMLGILLTALISQNAMNVLK